MTDTASPNGPEPSGGTLSDPGTGRGPIPMPHADSTLRTDRKRVVKDAGKTGAEDREEGAKGGTARWAEGRNHRQGKMHDRAEEESRMRAVIESAPDSIITMDSNGRVLDFNQAAERTFGFTRAEAVGRLLAELIIPPGLREHHQRGVQEYLRTGEGRIFGKRLELIALRRDGTELPVELTVAVLPEGPRTVFAAILRDVSERKRREQDLRDQAFLDPLTGLVNRATFVNRLEHEIRRCRRHPDHRFAVLFLDLDRFKTINDSLGHVAGDKLLQQVAERVAAHVRAADTAARLGGDEFAVLIEDLAGTDDALTVAQRLVEAMRKPFDLDGHEVRVTASVGIASNRSDTVSAEAVLRDADIAMYRAKADGKNRFRRFLAPMREEATAALERENDLRRAVEREEFTVVFQPIVAVEGNRIAALEALVRWNHPEHGLIPPAGFLDVAEETRLIVPIGWFVFEEACRWLRQWGEELPAAMRLRMNVNFSPTQIGEDGFADRFATGLQRHGIQPDDLVLEITERTVFMRTDRASETLSRLASLGATLCIDDFGTGYASLSSLRQFPFGMLKIDRSFIGDTGRDEENWRIVEGIIRLAHSLKIDVVAEGVETAGQRDRLKRLGCDYVQGYWFSEPVRPAKIAGLLSASP